MHRNCFPWILCSLENEIHFVLTAGGGEGVGGGGESIFSPEPLI